MMMTISMILILNFIFLISSHPLAMGLTMLFYTICIALISGFSSSSFWYAYILVLIFLGGILVIFIYVSSLASNEVVAMKFNMSTFVIPSLLILLFYFLFNSSMYLETFTQEKTPNSLIWMFSSSFLILSSFIICYLFFVLIAVAKITKFWGGAIRPLN